jgi:thioredoxin-related protein
MLTSLYAIEWLSYEEGLKLQEKSGKIVMIDIVRSECHFCNEMEVEVFNNKEMIKYLGERFIAVKINLDKDTLPLGIKIHFTPSFFFIDKEQKIVKKIPGAWNIQDFKDLTKGIK